MIIRKPNEGEIELTGWPSAEGNPPFIRLIIEEEDYERPSITMTAKEAARLAGILDAWAEKGYLPEKDEVWE